MPRLWFSKNFHYVFEGNFFSITYCISKVVVYNEFLNLGSIESTLFRFYTNWKIYCKVLFLFSASANSCIMCRSAYSVGKSNWSISTKFSISLASEIHFTNLSFDFCHAFELFFFVLSILSCLTFSLSTAWINLFLTSSLYPVFPPHSSIDHPPQIT